VLPEQLMLLHSRYLSLLLTV